MVHSNNEWIENMKVGGKYSHCDGEAFISANHGAELIEIYNAISSINAVDMLCKISHETSKPPLIFSPEAINRHLKLGLSQSGWTTPCTTGKKGFTEPRLYWNGASMDFHNAIGEKSGNNEFREMDGIKNKVGLEIQFGKYAFMGYDIFSKMPIFSKRGLIDCGIEVVAMPSLIPNMSTGVSSFSQIEMDLRARGVADIDIPVLIIGIECTEVELQQVATKRARFLTSRDTMIANGEVQGPRDGARPGPK